MELQLKNLKNEALLAIKAIKDKLQLEELENKYLGRKSGELTELMKGLKDLSDTAKKTVGPLANEVKLAVEQALSQKRNELSQADWSASLQKRKNRLNPAGFAS